MALSIGAVMTITVTVATIALLAWFTRTQQGDRIPLKQIPRAFLANRYYIHAAVFPVMAALKLFVDRFNDPVKSLRGDYTQWVHAVEGDVVLYIQHVFENPALTAILNFHYLFVYALLFVLVPLYFMYVRERDLADKAMMNYVVIYALAVPYYLFFNVDVTSTFIPGMKALLYHHSPLYFDFFAATDPLDNAFPSLHTAIPFGMLFIHFLHCRGQGHRVRDWKHVGLNRFILGNTAVFMFSILYLGIHWIVDIAAGVLLAFIGALAVHAIHPYLRRDRLRKMAPVPIRGFRAGRAVTIGLAVLVALPVLSAQDDASVDRPNMQLGPGDVKTDIIGPVPPEGPIGVHVTLLGGNRSVEALLVALEDVPALAEDGRINWTAVAADRAVAAVAPNTTLSFEASGEDSLHVLLVHDPRTLPPNATVEDVVDAQASEVQIRSTYPDTRFEESVLLSLPSFAITGAVLHRQWQLRRTDLHWTSDVRLT